MGKPCRAATRQALRASLSLAGGGARDERTIRNEAAPGSPGIVAPT